MKHISEAIKDRFRQHYWYRLEGIVIDDLLKKLEPQEIDLHELVGDVFITLNAKKSISEWDDDDESLFRAIGARLDAKSLLTDFKKWIE